MTYDDIFIFIPHADPRSAILLLKLQSLFFHSALITGHSLCDPEVWQHLISLCSLAKDGAFKELCRILKKKSRKRKLSLNNSKTWAQQTSN